MNHAIYSIFFTELKTIPMMIVVTVHSRMETIVKVIKKKETQASHVNTHIKDNTVTVFLRTYVEKKIHV